MPRMRMLNGEEKKRHHRCHQRWMETMALHHRTDKMLESTKATVYFPLVPAFTVPFVIRFNLLGISLMILKSRKSVGLATQCGSHENASQPGGRQLKIACRWIGWASSSACWGRNEARAIDTPSPRWTPPHEIWYVFPFILLIDSNDKSFPESERCN